MDGVTLNVSCWSAPYPKWLAEYIPEFEEQTGAKVNYDTPGFPVYNQRVDLELSTQGSAFDVLNVTFIYSSRWIGAGWFEPLEPYMEDPSKTPPEWQPADFLPGAVGPLKDKDGVIYGVPWIADAYMAAAGRFDLLERRGARHARHLRRHRRDVPGGQRPGRASRRSSTRTTTAGPGSPICTASAATCSSTRPTT